MLYDTQGRALYQNMTPESGPKIAEKLVGYGEKAGEFRAVKRAGGKIQNQVVADQQQPDVRRQLGPQGRMSQLGGCVAILAMDREPLRGEQPGNRRQGK